MRTSPTIGGYRLLAHACAGDRIVVVVEWPHRGEFATGYVASLDDQEWAAGRYFGDYRNALIDFTNRLLDATASAGKA